MIVPARVFLILLVPLLLHAAPAGPPHAPSSGGAKDYSWLDMKGQAEPGQIASNPHTLGNVDVPVSPSPESNLALVGTHSYETWDANQPSHDQQPLEGFFLINTNHALIEYDDTLAIGTCRLPKGTIYRIKHRTNIIYTTPDSRYPLKTDRIAITPQGVMIDLPGGSFVRESGDPNSIVLPIVPRSIELKNKIQLRDTQTACVVPTGIKYTVESSPNMLRNFEKPKKRDNLFAKSDRIVYTQEGLLLLPAGTTILFSDTPGYMDLPTSNTEIRIISQKGRDKVEDFCNKFHKKYVPPSGKLNEPRESYMPRCRYINTWLVGRTELREVPIRPRTIRLKSVASR